LQQFVKIFLEHGENMIKSLKNTETIVEDLESFVGEFTLNTICGTVSCVHNYTDITLKKK